MNAVERLAQWYLAILAVIAVATTLYLPGYLRHLRQHTDLRIFSLAYPTLLLSMCLVIGASSAVPFLICWELMSLSSFLLVATEHTQASTRHAAVVYLGATRCSTAFIAGGFLWAHALTGSWAFDDWHLAGAAALGPGMLVLIGLGIKAGMWPFHLWLPIAHPAAPAPVSAWMSGVMVKVALYVIIRLFVVSAAFSHPALGVTILVLGAISAFWGVAFALLQQDLKRLLAYHTVENVGLILAGIGGAMVAQQSGLPHLARLALAAALLHSFNHALFKTLLFLGAGTIHQAAGTADLERLGGLGKRLPFTFACFVLGSAAICALPPLNGFGSEWLLYQTGLGFAIAPLPAGARFAGLLGIGWLGLVGALALACFVKVCGVTFLGVARSAEARQAHEGTLGMRLGQLLLVVGCVGFGLFVPALLRLLDPITAVLEPGGASLASLWVVPLWQMLAVLVPTSGALALWMASVPPRPYLTWECGFGPLTPRMQTTATSFAQPIARMFSWLFRYAVHLRIEGTHRRLFPDEIVVEPTARGGLENTVYQPFLRAFDRLGNVVLRLQAGSIHLYLLTMFITLLALLYVGGRP